MKWRMDNSLTSGEVKKYLQNHPRVVEEFLLKSASTEMLENLILKKKRLISEHVYNNLRLERRKSTWMSSTQLYTYTGLEEMCRKICTCSNDLDIYHQIYNVSHVISNMLESEGFLLYTLDASETGLAKFTPEKGPVDYGPIEMNTTVAGHVASEKEPINIKNVHTDTRFPQGFGDDYKECHALCSPILTSSGEVFCVIAFVRTNLDRPFDEYDIEMATGVLSWIMACVQKIKLNKVSSLLFYFPII